MTDLIGEPVTGPGPTIDVFDPEVLREPDALYERLLAEARVHPVPGTPFVLVAGWDEVQDAVLRTEDFSSNMHTIVLRRPDGEVGLDLWGDGTVEQVLAIADDPDHKLHRTVVLQALNRRIRTLQDVATRFCADLWDAAAAGGRTDWVVDVADRLPVQVIAHLIGLPLEDADTILDLTYRTTELLGGVVEEDRLDAVLTAPLELWEYLEGHLDHALASPGDDLLGALAVATHDGSLEAGTAVGILMQVINAGSESTASLIGNAARLLAEDPTLAARIRADRSLLDPFIDETLRLESPFRGHYRHVPRDTTLAGVRIPAGASVLLLWGAANRDPLQFPDPLRVDLDRPAVRRHLGFGRGAHFCVGSSLARLEATVALSALLDGTTAFTLDPERPPERVPSVMMRRHAHLPLLLEPSR